MMQTLRQAARMEAVQTPVIPVIGDLIRSTPGTISLGQGIVSYGPPREAVDALASFGGSIEDHRYGPVEGLPDLVAAIAEKLRRENGIAVTVGGAPGAAAGKAGRLAGLAREEHSGNEEGEKGFSLARLAGLPALPASVLAAEGRDAGGAGRGSRVLVTAGGNMAFMNAVLAVADPGDEIILLAPFYFNHDMAIVMAGCRTVSVPTDAAYQPRLDAIRAAITPRTRAIVTVSPNNPSGAMYSEAALREINEMCRAHGVYHINDEAYEYFVYDGARHVSPGARAGAAEHTISLFSLSKAYGFASWRIGYMVIPAHLFDAVNKIQDTNLICPPAVSQRAALAALGTGAAYCRPHVARLADVRDLVRQELDQVADICTAPAVSGAFYFLLRIHTRMDAFTLVERLIREHGVAAIPGTAFGLTDGCYLRISYGALDRQSVAAGVSRLVGGLRALVTS